MPADAAPAAPIELPKSLTRVLGRSERVKDLVEECAEELISVNSVLKYELADVPPTPQVEGALHQSVVVAGKVEKASKDLANVNRALEGEIRDRHILDHQLAALREQEESARHASFHDDLTGLANRALFNDRLQHAFAQAKRHGWSLAVMFMDLDGFKKVNDEHGHDAGDSVLKAVAQRLKANARGEDTVSRMGGDEFLYLLTEVKDERSIGLIAEKISQAIQQPIDIDAGEVSIKLSVRASIGISLFPKHGTTVDTLVISADLAMYQAKQRKSGYAFAT
ncbi:MAG: GGDEF domain-containing protein [Candidatus Parcubacteria bacterium]|nr:GGDEF domain-containing protein [Burkholderiales bacterium]